MTPLPSRIRFVLPMLLVFLALVASTGPAGAQTWTEQGDAGDLLSTAQHTVGNGPLTSISGTLPLDSDVDLYCISITDAANFSASLLCTVISGNDIWLFDANGFGVARDRGCQTSQTRVGAPLVSGTGIYYVAVAGNDGRALNGASDIWTLGVPVNGQVAPNGSAAGLPLTGWIGGAVNPSAYTIQLVGASFCDSATPALLRTWGRTKVIYR